MPGVLATVVLVLLVAQSAGGTKPPTILRTERATNPPGGVRTPLPRLSWELGSVDLQSAFQVHAASSRENLLGGRPLLWDSGRVETDDSLNGAVFNASLLSADQTVFWRVRIWSTLNGRSGWSVPAFFRVGRRSENDWAGAWITAGTAEPPASAEGANDCNASVYADRPNSIFRRTFTTRPKKTVQEATLYISGLGYYRFELNGKHVPGDTFLDPALTTYSRRVPYMTMNVTSEFAVERQSHVIEISLGNGWYNPLPMLMWGRMNLRKFLPVGNQTLIRMDLVLKYTDGSKQVVATSTDQLNQWKTAEGPWLKNNIYLGTKFDQRRSNLVKRGLPANDWVPATLAPTAVLAGLGPMSSQEIPPIRSVATLQGRKVGKALLGEDIWDFGRNFAGVVNVTLKGPMTAGTAIEFKYGELLWPNGSVNVMTSVAGQIKHRGTGGACCPDIAYQRDVYIADRLGPGETVSFVPRFVWHGFRYVEVNSPAVESIDGLVLRTDVEEFGHFEVASSDGGKHIFNDIWKMVSNTHGSNMMSIQSDCPHRERFGYGGDMLATAETALHLYDMSAFYRKRVEDYNDAQRDDGAFTETAPFVGLSTNGLNETDGSGSIGWDSVQPILQLFLYKYYGDRRSMEDFYSSTKQWVEFLEHVPRAKVEDGLSDWMNVETNGNVRALTGEIFLWRNYDAWAKINEILGKPGLADAYREKANKVLVHLNTEFLQKDGVYKGKEFGLTQCGQAMPLQFNLQPASATGAVLAGLVKSLGEASLSGPHMRTGMFCIKPLLFALTGKRDLFHLAYTILSRRDYPSYGYMLDNNATTLWESWFFSNNTYSHNHPMFSSVSVWFIQVLGGIRQKSTSTAYSTIVLMPRAPGPLDATLKGVNCTLRTLRGVIESNWTVIGSDRCTCNWRFSVPFGSTAEIGLPGKNITTVQGGGTHELFGVNLCEPK